MNTTFTVVLLIIFLGNRENFLSKSAQLYVYKKKYFAAFFCSHLMAFKPAFPKTASEGGRNVSFFQLGD
jgi:hypothetical protein